VFVFSREERRWIEKQNKSARAKLKKEESARIRSAVDNAYAADPRIVFFKEEQLRLKREKKDARKNAVREKEQAEAQVSPSSRGRAVFLPVLMTGSFCSFHLW